MSKNDTPITDEELREIEAHLNQGDAVEEYLGSDDVRRLVAEILSDRRTFIAIVHAVIEIKPDIRAIYKLAQSRLPREPGSAVTDGVSASVDPTLQYMAYDKPVEKHWLSVEDVRRSADDVVVDSWAEIARAAAQNVDANIMREPTALRVGDRVRIKGYKDVTARIVQFLPGGDAGYGMMARVEIENPPFPISTTHRLVDLEKLD